MQSGKILTTLGALFIVAAIAFAAYNVVEEKRAGLASSAVLEQMDERLDDQDDRAAAFGADEAMPTVEIDGRQYVGVLSVPSLGLELPVLSEWSYEGLNVAPCRYVGSAYVGNLVVCGHNYRTHFAGLGGVAYGAEVLFTDVRGNVFRYEVASVESLDSAGVESMIDSDYELTLFTCNLSGAARVTVRCSMA